MFTSLLALLLACGGPTATSIALEGDAAKTVHTTDALALNPAKVLDAEGKELAEAPAVTWTVTPDTVAKIDGTNIVPLANGEATITAAVGDIKAEYKVTVALPDSLTVAGYTAGDAFAVGETKTLTATIKSGETVISTLTPTWASDNAAVATVDNAGAVTAVAEGTANITATLGALTSTTAVTIAAPAVADAPK